MEFNYTIDPNAEEPIMLIDRHIGMDEEDGEGIMGDKFSRELMFLDTLNKSRIKIWINSPGGTVTDGQQIYNTILLTKTKVDTYNVGMAASIALPIFLAGRNRYMMDNTTAMIHPISGGDFKSRAALEQAVNTMLSSRSFIPPEKITEMMNRTTWLSAADCGPEGLNLCEVQNSNEHNKPRKTPETDGIKASWKEYKSVVNKLIEDKKPKIMTKVTNRLKLVDGADESMQLAAIDAIENRAITAEGKLIAQEAENKVKVDVLNSQLATLKAEKDLVDKKIKDIEDADKTAKAAENKVKATDLITNAVKKGQIADDAAVIKDWTDEAIENFDRAKNKLEKLPINVKGPQILNKLPEGKRDVPEGSAAPSIDVNNTAAFVAQMNAKTFNNAKNRFK